MSTNYENQVTDIQTLYLAMSLIEVAGHGDKVPPEVHNKYKDYLEADKKTANENIRAVIAPMYYKLKIFMEGEDWAVRG